MHNDHMADDELERKRRRVRILQRYLLNPPMKALTWMGLTPGHALVETHGRRSGKRRRTIVGMSIEGSTGWVVAEHGRHAGYVRNLEARPEVRVRVSRQWLEARATVLDNDDADARLEIFDGKHASAVRRFGTDLTTIRFDFAVPPAT